MKIRFMEMTLAFFLRTDPEWLQAQFLGGMFGVCAKRPVLSFLSGLTFQFFFPFFLGYPLDSFVAIPLELEVNSTEGACL